MLNICLISFFFCYCKSITIASIVATLLYFQVINVVLNGKLTHVIDEIHTIEKNVEIWWQIVKFLMTLVKNGYINNAMHALL